MHIARILISLYTTHPIHPSHLLAPFYPPLRSLGRASSPALIKRTLALPLSDEVKGQDLYLPIAALRTHEAGIRALWAWMKENWDVLEKKLPPGLTMLSTVVQMCTASFATKEQLKEVEGFFEGRSTKGFDRALEQSKDSIRAKASWLGRDRADVEGWLKMNGFLEKGKL